MQKPTNPAMIDFRLETYQFFSSFQKSQSQVYHGQTSCLKQVFHASQHLLTFLDREKIALNHCNLLLETLYS